MSLSILTVGTYDGHDPDFAPNVGDHVVLLTGTQEDVRAAAAFFGKRVILVAEKERDAEIAGLREQLERLERERDDEVTAAYRPGNALYSTILKRLEPHFPPGNRDLEWDVLPGTLGALARERDTLRTLGNALANALAMAIGPGDRSDDDAVGAWRKAVRS